MKNIKFLILFFFGLTLSNSVKCQSPKVAGFFGDWHPASELNNVQWDKLTDIYYAFMYTDGTGNVRPATSGAFTTILTPMVSSAHANGVKCHISLGGATHSSANMASSLTPANRTTFINNIINTIQTYDLDGFNMDWEFPTSTTHETNLTNFMTELRSAMDVLEGTMGKNLELSGAVAPLVWNNDYISSTFTDVCDYVFVMAFDAGGACCVCDVNHSSHTVAENSMLKWATSAGIPNPPASCGGNRFGKNVDPSKIVLAIPFYSTGPWAQYKNFSNSDPATYYNDPDGIYGGYNYNSKPMIDAKVDLIMNTYGGAGIWCWELPDDRTDQYSLLGAMWDAMQPYMCNAGNPDLGADVSLCGSGSVLLDCGVPTDGSTTFEWFRNSVSQGAPSTSANTFTATQAGTWSVVVDNGSCSETDEIIVSATMPSVDLGGPYDLCSPASQLLDAGISGTGYSYAWTKDAVTILGATSQTYTATEAGTYEVTVSASGCSSVSDNAVVTSSLPVGTNDTICSAGTANLGADQSVDWYDQATNGTLLNTGSSYSPSIGSSTTYYIEATGGSANYTIGKSSLAGGWYSAPQNYAHRFEVFQTLTIDQISFDIQAGGNANIRILQSDGSTMEDETGTFSVVAGPNTVSVGITLNPGVYYMTAIGSSVNWWLDTDGSGSDYTEPGIITIDQTADVDWGSGYVNSTYYGHFHTWEISTGTACDRVAVEAVIDAGHSSCGSCDDPGTATLSPSSPPAQCGGSVTLTASESGTGSFEYEFFRGGVSVQGPGASNTYNATQSGSYTVEITDPSDPGTCVSVSSAVSVTIDDAPSTASAGTNQTVCEGDAVNLSANNPTTGTGVWSTISGTGTADSPSSNTSSVSGLTAGASTTFRWTISNGVCPDETDEVTITVDAAPSTASAGANQTVCEGTAVNLSATNPSTGTGSWSTVSGTGTADSPSSNTSSVSGLTAGASTTFRWTVSNGVCTDETDDVAVTVDAAPSTSFAGTNQTVCSSTATLSANNPSIGTGSWSTVSGTGTADSPSSNTSTVSGLTAGTTTLRWTVSNGVCPDETSDVDITRSGSITTASAGSDQTICETDVVNLSANAAGGGETGTWTSSGDGTFSNANDENATYTPGGGDIASGTVTLTWTIDNGICTPSADDMTVTIDQSPSTASAGTNQTVCETDVVNLSANNPTTGTGVWSTVTGTGTADSPSSNTSSVSGLTGGASTTFRWTISNGVCPDVNDEVIITADASPSTADAGTDQTICADNAVMAANTPTVGSGSWSIVSGSPTITSSSDPSTTVTNISVGTVTLRWEISNGVCAVSSDEVDITRTASSPADVSISPATVSVCDGDNVSFTANPVNGGTTPNYEWFVNSVSMQNGTSASYNYTPASGDEVYVVMTSNLGCATGSPATSSSVFPTVDQVPTTALAGSDDSYCAANYPLQGNTPSIGTGTWAVVSGTATINTPSDPNSTVIIPDGQMATLSWTISNGACPSSTDQVDITNSCVSCNDPGTATLSPLGPVTQCGGNVTLTASESGTGSFEYEFYQDGFSVQGPSASNTYSATTSGDYHVVITDPADPGTCFSTSNTVTITIDQAPDVATAGTNQSVCTNSATLGANTPAVGTGMWTVISGTGSFANASDPNTTVSGLMTGVNTLRWTISNGSCSDETDEITITVSGSAAAAVSISEDANPICSGEMVNFTAVPTNGGASPTYEWFVNSGSVQGPSSSATFSSSSFNNGDQIHCVMTSSLGCATNNPATSSSVTMTVNSNVTPAVSITADQSTICTGTNVTFTASSNGGGGTPVYQWKLNSTNVGANSSTYSNSTLNDGDVVEVEMTSSETCTTTNPVSSNQLTVDVHQNPSTADAGADQNLTCPSTSTSFTASTPAVGTGTWTLVSGSGTIATPGSATSSVTSLGAGTNTFQWTVTNGVCPSSSDQVDIIVPTCSSDPVPDFTADDNSHCGSGTVTFTNASTNTSGGETYSWDFGAGASPATATGIGPHSVSYSTAGDYTVSLTINDGVSDFTETKTDFVSIIDFNTAISGNTVVNCNSSNEIFTATGNSGSSYNWSTNLGTITSGQGTTSIVIDFTGVTGSANISATEINSGCLSSPASHIANVCPSSVDPGVSSVVEFYPNPFEGVISVKTNLDHDFGVEVYDLAGVELYKGIHDNNESIDLNDLPAGVYLLRVTFDGYSEIKRIVKQ